MKFVLFFNEISVKSAYKVLINNDSALVQNNVMAPHRRHSDPMMPGFTGEFYDMCYQLSKM